MKFLLKSVVAGLISLFLGVGSALGLIFFPPMSLGVKNGAWTTNLKIGSADAGMYLRAVIARVALFALNKTETIYYHADHDDEGESLRSGCDYRIEGRDLDARWWSITLYGGDNFLIPNHERRYSFNLKNVAREADGTYRIFISLSEKEGNWIPSGGRDQPLSLSLRCYNPAPIVYEKPEEIELPRIIREGCR